MLVKWSNQNEVIKWFFTLLHPSSFLVLLHYQKKISKCKVACSYSNAVLLFTYNTQAYATKMHWIWQKVCKKLALSTWFQLLSDRISHKRHQQHTLISRTVVCSWASILCRALARSLDSSITARWRYCLISSRSASVNYSVQLTNRHRAKSLPTQNLPKGIDFSATELF